ncbi:family 2 encapsulin nanocompartment cargo protein terpene cyclase [Streptomyces sp. NPDC001093]|uniref:family 2 encapsulin nanocompartment cargo protein terpene cyclase n=1 Tax=Streptomyces sp. NPDC001093 TaxID=3154376 RepID=UPI0033309BA6
MAERSAEAGQSAAVSSPGGDAAAGHQPGAGQSVAAGQSAPGGQPVPGADAASIGLPAGPTGLGTSAAALGRTGPGAAAAAVRAGRGASAALLAPTGKGASAAVPAPTGPGASVVDRRVAILEPRRKAPAEASVSDVGPRLHCPPAVRDDPALGELVTERLVEWAEEVGIYPGRLDRIRKADFGRLIMLAHPESDDPDRLLAAAKCALSEWAVDDHYVDGEVEEARPQELGRRLAIAHSVIDQAHLPLAYAPQLEEVVRADPVMRALRDSLRNLHTYATTSQVRRLRHELGIMFVAYNQEGYWQAAGHRPPVWEYLMHRHENSFIPCMVLVDAIAGYEIPYGEFADPRVRRAFTLAGTATVIVNDLYSMAKEKGPTDYSLPRLIAAEDGCSLEEAVDRTVDIHNELMLTFEAEAAALAQAGSPELRRFLAGTWAWVGGSREWHASSARYHETAKAA